MSNFILIVDTGNLRPGMPNFGSQNRMGRAQMGQRPGMMGPRMMESPQRVRMIGLQGQRPGLQMIQQQRMALQHQQMNRLDLPLLRLL